MSKIFLINFDCILGGELVSECHLFNKLLLFNNHNTN